MPSAVDTRPENHRLSTKTASAVDTCPKNHRLSTKTASAVDTRPRQPPPVHKSHRRNNKKSLLRNSEGFLRCLAYDESETI